MAIFALSDLHLSLSNPEKSMTVFGPKWDDYIERIRQAWTETVTEEDTVLVSGDISWDEEASRNGHGLDGLVDGSGTYALDVDRNAVLDATGDGAGDGCRRGF